MVGGAQSAGGREVVLTSGHLTDEPERVEPRFPATLEPVVRERIEALFGRWAIGEDHLVFSGGARGADILFAECALARRAQVRLFLALPPAQFVARSVAVPGESWEDRFYQLLSRCRVDVLPEESRRAGQSPFEAANLWMVDEALRRCPPAHLRAALVWDEQPGDGQGGTAGMAALLRRHGVQPVVINPVRLAAGGPTNRPL